MAAEQVVHALCSEGLMDEEHAHEAAPDEAADHEERQDRGGLHGLRGGKFWLSGRGRKLGAGEGRRKGGRGPAVRRLACGVRRGGVRAFGGRGGSTRTPIGC